MGKIKERRGFSIIELMIVVAIITILVVIAVPAYMLYTRKVKSSEAVYHANAIRTYQISYRAMNDTYLELTKNPAGNVPATYQNWGNPGGNWDKLGFKVENRIRYQYSAEPGVTSNISNSFKIIAQTDFDFKGDPFDTWELTSDGELTHTNHYK